ncbi:MAG: hypothetical protein AAFX00_09300 [Pseudomonadota bacterium]
MNILIGTVLLWGAAIWLWRKLPDGDWRQAALESTWATLRFTGPRVVVALIGAGLFAELLPEQQIQRFFGEDAGVLAILMATLAGPITPGGPFVAFAISAAALKSGATVMPIVAYITSWSLFALTKVMAYELSILGTPTFVKRVAVSLPLPFAVGIMAQMVLG